MKLEHLRALWSAVLAGGVSLFLHGCSDVDTCHKETGPTTTVKAAKTARVKFELQEPNLSAAAPAESRALAVTRKIQPQRVALVATQDTSYYYESMPNGSVGKFIAQATVALAPVKGLTNGQSLVGLAFAQGRPGTASERVFYMSATYNSTINGYTATAAGLVSNFATMNFSNISQLDLRIEETDTQFILSARETPANQSAGGWMQIHAENAALSPLPFHSYIGVQHVQKGATAYFTNFAMDGDAIAGVTGYSIITDLRASVEAIRSAQAKIEVAAPDLAGAATDLQTAATKNDSALAKINLALADFALERPGGGIVALKVVKAAVKGLADAHTAVATGDPKKAKPQIAKLDTVAGSQLSAIANMLGWKAPNLKSAPPIFSLRIP